MVAQKTVIAIVFLALLLYAGSIFYSGELQFKTVLSGSMLPVFGAGDVVAILKTAPKEIKEGDIITFHTGKTFTTHRVIEIANGTFRTKGDANEDPDASAVRADSVTGKVIFAVPYLGYFGKFVRTPLGFVLFILIPGVLIIYSELKKIFGELKKKDEHTPTYNPRRIYSKSS